VALAEDNLIFNGKPELGIPGIFSVQGKTSLAAATEVQQKVKAELKTHMNKGKWG